MVLCPENKKHILFIPYKGLHKFVDSYVKPSQFSYFYLSRVCEYCGKTQELVMTGADLVARGYDRREIYKLSISLFGKVAEELK